MTSPLREPRISCLSSNLGLGEGPKLTISLSPSCHVSRVFNKSDVGLLGLLVILKFLSLAKNDGVYWGIFKVSRKFLHVTFFYNFFALG